jgi:sigma-B regulation protein RsbU (phosphoserine phosphatase)
LKPDPPTTVDTGPPITLHPITGPAVEPIQLVATQPATLGRSSVCDVQLPDQSVSRRHAEIRFQGDRWLVKDLGSRHGTTISGIPLTENEPSPIGHGDSLAIGPWLFRVQVGRESRPGLATTNDYGDTRAKVVAIPEAELSSLAERRLSVFMDCASSIQAAEDEEALSSSVLEAVLHGTGSTRAALVRPLTSIDEVELIGSREVGRAGAPEFSISRSLLRGAAEGHVVRMTESSEWREAVSVIELGIQSAICAPVFVGNEVQAFLYLDTREPGKSMAPDAAAFTGAVARLCGLAMANIRRHALEKRQRQLDADLNAAREAQVRIMPPSSGKVGAVHYAMKSIPGRVVAGDLFDIVDLEDGHVACMLGDVTGKGMGAAVVMAMAQSHLHAALRRPGDLAEAMCQANRYIAARSAEYEFVSLWLGVVDSHAGVLRYIDGGHGYCIRCRPGAAPEPVRGEGCLVVGVEPSYEYACERIEMHDGDRIVLFSDGVVEQCNPAGEQFGMDRVLEALADSKDAAGDTTRLIEAIQSFAETRSLADDVTVASISLSTAG